MGAGPWLWQAVLVGTWPNAGKRSVLATTQWRIVAYYGARKLQVAARDGTSSTTGVLNTVSEGAIDEHDAMLLQAQWRSDAGAPEICTYGGVATGAQLAPRARVARNQQATSLQNRSATLYRAECCFEVARSCEPHSPLASGPLREKRIVQQT